MLGSMHVLVIWTTFGIPTLSVVVLAVELSQPRVGG
jgi:hypothetical protein